MAEINDEKSETSDAFVRFQELAKVLFAVPKHELDEEIAKEKAETKSKKPMRKTRQHERKEAA